ncbi:hypothetical protein A1O7_02810 [Cladophialophora yegresii CBS 114405]|uniref:Uncharacterized protein n=1 Tax=Cladophialophora yegresii CBS 114405 TaxID=1182544 RepID=W9WCV3_9EURO|nr:uncharacterized protein A1O7_02810 [Cladophialophora yegresii CBS 114405]EXJ62376.1 hypothetical protein A1O7_02810 [Cladophialophora yegresii CBS 114405]
MASLLNGLPEIPRLRRRPGRRNLQSDRPPSHHDVDSNSDVSTVGHNETGRAEAPDQATQADSSQQPRESRLDHNLRAQLSVSEAVEAQVFASPAVGGGHGSPGPTIRHGSDSPSPAFLPRTAISDTSLVSAPHRPRNPMVQNFTVGSETLSDPFLADPGRAQARGNNRREGHQLWSELSSSSDSRPSPVYQGNGVYVLHDGTIHDIRRSRRRIQEARGSQVRSNRGDMRDTSSDEANHADRSDSPSGGSDSLPSRPPRTAVRRLQTVVSNLEGFTSPAAREAVRDLEQAVDGVSAIVATLIHEMEVHAYNAEERRRRFAAQTSELVVAHRMIQARDREIARLSHPEVYGENATPPEYASDAQQDPQSVTVTRTPAGTQDNTNNNSPTPATVVRRPALQADNARDRQVSVTAEAGSAAPSYRTSPDTDRRVSVTAEAGAAAPSYRTSPDPDPESVIQPQVLTPEVVAQGSPASSQSGESDNVMLTRTPRFRRPTV